MAKCDDIEHWDAQGLENVIGTMDNIHKSHMKLGDTLEGVQANLSSWGGETAEAWHRYHGKTRVDVDDHGHQAKAVADKLRPLYDEVLSIKSQYRYLKATIVGNGSYDKSGELVHWKLNNDGSINTSGAPLGDMQSVATKQELEGQMKALLHKADGVDAEIADALKAITTPGGAVADSPHVGQPAPQPEHKPDQSLNASGQTDPKDLPLKAPGGDAPNPTAATADNSVHDSPSYLKPNQHPSPLLAGLSADEWRTRLAHFQPGEPLPDPRTPTGDKAIDSLAHAAGQQNTSYAWGGNLSKSGPSVGQPDGKGIAAQGADTFQDWKRHGYDCGGLVRYSLEQGAGMDVGKGTDTIDQDPRFVHPFDGGLKSDVAASKAQAGDVLIFGGGNPFHGGGSQHTGIYIGNGYMMNAPGSGMPVRTDLVGPGRGPTDVLRVP